MSYVPNFAPSTHAPLFHNSPWPADSALKLSVPGLPSVGLDTTRFGLCGGMSFLTRDTFESGTPQLRGTDSRQVPEQLVDHLMRRLVDSFLGRGTIAKWLAKSQASDDSWFGGEGVYAQTVDECADIMRDIDRGRLCPIGVVIAHSWSPLAVFSNHVELAWGYELDGTRLRLHTYDCNRPGDDGITIELDIAARSPARPITTNGTDMPDKPGHIRGVFRLPYDHADPSPAYVDAAVVRVVAVPPPGLAPGSSADVRVVATNTGSTTWTSAAGYRLGSQSPRDTTVWGLHRVELDGAVDPQQQATFAFTATAPVGAGVPAFCWQLVREGVHWFGNVGCG